MRSRHLAVLTVSVVLLCTACEKKITIGSSSDGYQAKLDAYCAERGKEVLDASEKLTRLEAFYSWKINTCVQVEVSDSDKDWSYYIRDVTNGFLRGPKLTTDEQPLTVYHHEDRYYWHASAEGYWQSTDSSKDKRLIGPIVAKIECEHDEHVCRESDASVFIELIQADSHEYNISTWTQDGIVADDTDEGDCGIGHRLTIDFKSNSVVVTDYPTKVGGSDLCKAFQTANSYALHGGSIGYFEMHQIFTCGSAGVNNAVLEKVNKLHGDVADKTYTEWMDNGEGGPPATVKTPPHPYSRDDCDNEMEKKLKELRGN